MTSAAVPPHRSSKHPETIPLGFVKNLFKGFLPLFPPPYGPKREVGSMTTFSFFTTVLETIPRICFNLLMTPLFLWPIFPPEPFCAFPNGPPHLTKSRKGEFVGYPSVAPFFFLPRTPNGTSRHYIPVPTSHSGVGGSIQGLEREGPFCKTCVWVKFVLLSPFPSLLVVHQPKKKTPPKTSAVFFFFRPPPPKCLFSLSSVFYGFFE